MKGSVLTCLPPKRRGKVTKNLKGGDILEKQKLPEDLEKLLRQLVCNGSVPMAGRALQLYAWRCMKLDRESANTFVLQYFEDVFPKDLERYRNKQRRP